MCSTAPTDSTPRPLLPTPGKAAAEPSIGSVRDPWFQLVNDAVDASLASGGPLRGSLFWQVGRHLPAAAGAVGNQTPSCARTQTAPHLASLFCWTPACLTAA